MLGSCIVSQNQERGGRFNKPIGVRTAILALFLLPNDVLAQTTRTNPSAASTSPTIPQSASTSPNTPCVFFNPTSPCYSAKVPRRPCYSAVSEPCSPTTTLTAQPSPSPLPSPTKKPPLAIVHAFTQDQAKAQIEAKGYLNVSELRREGSGIWRGKAEKDGGVRNVTLDREGNVTEN